MCCGTHCVAEIFSNYNSNIFRSEGYQELALSLTHSLTDVFETENHCLVLDNSLWHKVDISNFHHHKIVNFCNNFVGLTIPDDLKSKIWKF